MPMSTTIHGQDVPLDVAYGLCHQVVRTYAAGQMRGYTYPAGQTTTGLPWFTDFRKAVDFLVGAPFAGYVQSHVLKEDGSGPSWVTAGVYFRKEGGRLDGPVSTVIVELDVTNPNFASARQWLSANGDRSISYRVNECIVHEVRVEVHAGEDIHIPECLQNAFGEARLWCCQSVMFYISDYSALPDCGGISVQP